MSERDNEIDNRRSCYTPADQDFLSLSCWSLPELVTANNKFEKPLNSHPGMLQVHYEVCTFADGH